MSFRWAGRSRRRLFWTVGGCLTTIACAVGAQEASDTLAGGDRRVRVIVSGGAALPLGGFGDYHDLGAQASAAVVIRVIGKKVKLRPEVVYTQFRVARDKVIAFFDNPNLGAAPGGGARHPPPDLTKLKAQAVSRLLSVFANLELPLGPRGFQPYVVGGVGAINYDSDLNSVVDAVKSVTWGVNVGAGLRFRLGPIGAGLEARIRNVPLRDADTFYKNVTAIPVSFGLVF